MSRATSLLALVAFFLPSACTVIPAEVSLGVQRTVFPGLGDIPPESILAAFEREISLRPPVSAGLVWVTEDFSDRDPSQARSTLSDYERTGVLQATLDALRHDPFDTVGALPTVETAMAGALSRDAPSTLDHVRGACAQFQYDVALVLQTGVDEDEGYNAFAIGYLPLVTMALFPGTDLAAEAGAELFAIDVRTGIPLACGRGRALDRDRLVFPWQEGERGRRLREEVLSRAIGEAAADLLTQLESRLARHANE